MSTTALTARRVPNSRLYEIFCYTPEELKQYPDTKPLAKLTATGFFTSTDTEFLELVVAYARFAGKQALPERLALIRKAWDTLCADRAAEARAEQYAESAWLRQAEEGYFNPEEDARERYLEWLNS
jgi:hypothetical protein